MIVSHDVLNEALTWRSIIVVPCSTSTLHAQRGPTVVPIPRRAAAMPRSSVALCHQVTTLDRAKLVGRIGTLPAEILAEIGRGLSVALCL